MLPFIKPEKLTKFIIVSQDMSGFGFAKILKNEGCEVILAVSPKEEEDEEEKLWQVGEGMVDKVSLDDIVKKKNEYKDAIWIFDQNHNHEIADSLRKEGFYVIGGHEFTDKLEHDRTFGLSIVSKAGMTPPPSYEFSDIQSGLDLLDEYPESATVFKPDEPDNEAWVTTPPDSDQDIKANREIYKFLESQQDKGSYILQERKKGVEINVEYFLYDGKPILAHANFECKRKDNGDHGRMIGCASDIDFIIPLHCKILEETLDKLIALPEFEHFTGLIDSNIICADNHYWFLEFCGRFGYNSHPNMFLTLAISPLSEIFSDWVTGNVAEFAKHFRAGFGASMTCWIDKPVAGLPVIFDEPDVEKHFYHFDTYAQDESYYLAGYANETGIITAHDYDLHSAAEEVMRKFNKIHYSGRTARTDLDRKDYQSNPEERLIASNAMKLFNKGE